MKSLLIMAVMMCGFHSAGASDTSLVAVFWNLENFFDFYDGGEGESDREFSSFGSRHWTRKRFYAKCDAVAKAVFRIGDIYGRMPDFIGLAEIENKEVLKKLLSSTPLRKFGYRIIHEESSDRRGIDVAAIYRESSMTLVSSSFKTPSLDTVRMATRDILHAHMMVSDSSRIDFIVNHHPSKYGGEKESELRRMAAMSALRQMCDSIGRDHVVAMGDFNDTPDSEAFDLMDGVLVNKGSELHERGEGTIRYEGKWELIDMFLAGASLDKRTVMEVCRIPFLMVWDKGHPGMKPFRTYSGPAYIGGVSDHCPVVLVFK